MQAVTLLPSPAGPAGFLSCSPIAAGAPEGLQRTPTRNSVQSLPSVHSQGTTAEGSSSVVGTPLTAVTTPEGIPPASGIPGADIKSCVSCKQGAYSLPSHAYLSACSRATWHTSSQSSCSDPAECVRLHLPRLQHWPGSLRPSASGATPPVLWPRRIYTTVRTSPPIPICAYRVQRGRFHPQLWTVRKNASGRVWYTHNPSGFQTHVQPLTAAGEDTCREHESSARMRRQCRRQTGRFITSTRRQVLRPGRSP